MKRIRLLNLVNIIRFVSAFFIDIYSLFSGRKSDAIKCSFPMVFFSLLGSIWIYIYIRISCVMILYTKIYIRSFHITGVSKLSRSKSHYRNTDTYTHRHTRLYNAISIHHSTCWTATFSNLLLIVAHESNSTILYSQKNVDVCVCMELSVLRPGYCRKKGIFILLEKCSTAIRYG